MKTKPEALQSWDEVDLALRRIGELDIATEKLEGELTLKINQLKEEYRIKSEDILAERLGLEKRIKSFAESHKEDFLSSRTMQLTFGLVGYRVAKRVIISSPKSCVAALQSLGLQQYLVMTAKPDKEAMKELDPQTLAKVGAKVITDDKLRVEPNLEKLKTLAVEAAAD